MSVITKCNSGIYQIKNLVNEKIYIGSTNNFKRRKARHFSELRNNCHKNNYLQRSFNKYNEENFIFEILEYVEDRERLLEREQYWIDKYKPYINGYNLRIIAESNALIKIPRDVIIRRSQKRMGKKHSEESKQKMSKAHKGIKHSLETIEKRINKLKGQKRNKEQRDNISKSLKGKEKSENHKNNIKQAKRNLKHEEILDIVNLLFLKMPLVEIAEKYNVNETVIKNIKNGKGYDEYTTIEERKILRNNYKRILTKEEVREIEDLILKNIKMEEIMSLCHICRSTFFNIKRKISGELNNV